MRYFKRNTRNPGIISEVETGVYSNDYSVVFDGTDDYVTLGNVFDFERTDAFSVSVWTKILGNNQYMFTSKVKNDTTYRGWEFGMRNDGYLYFLLNNDYTGGNRLYARTSSVQRSVGNWRHYVVTYDGSSSVSGVSFYTNGSSQTVTNVYDTLTSTTVGTTALQFGKRDTLSSYLLYGYLDEVSIWEDELTSAEVSEIYNSGSPANLVEHSAVGDLGDWWYMGDEDTYPTLLGNYNGNDGTMTNMTAGDIIEDTP